MIAHVAHQCGSALKRLIVYFIHFIGLKNCELLDGLESSIFERAWCVTCQVSICRTADSADAREIGSVMGTIYKIVVSRFEWVVLYDNTTEGCRMGYKCFSNT
jgi:hypothetical protein